MATFQRPPALPSWDKEILENLPAFDRNALSLARSFHALEDLVQDTAAKAYTCIEKFQPGSNLRGWLVMNLRNTFYSGMRKQKREVAEPVGHFSATLVTHPEHDRRLAMSEFLSAFAKPSSEHRDIVTHVGSSGAFFWCGFKNDRGSDRNREKPPQSAAGATDRNAGCDCATGPVSGIAPSCPATESCAA